MREREVFACRHENAMREREVFVFRDENVVSENEVCVCVQTWECRA